MKLLSVCIAATTIGMMATAEARAQGQETPWPAAVPGFKEPASGEHPRLFFRQADLPAIRQRAQTPEGQAIVARLRLLLDGQQGTTMPEKFNPNRGRQARDGAANPVVNEPHGQAFTLFHAAGYGMLYQLTGDKRYADLGRQCVELMLEGQRDRDNRYAFRHAHGALRAGPSLGAMAMAYDLCYDGWDEPFRRTVALAIQEYNEGPNMSLSELVRGARHGPHSNHYGCQVGGGAMAVLAIYNDPGVDNNKIRALMQESIRAIQRQFSSGFGDGGMFWEGKGAGGIGSDTALIPGIQAWRVAGGQDFITPRPDVPAITMIKVHELVMVRGQPYYPIHKPSSYGTGFFGVGGRQQSDRDGLSRAGQFVQGFGAIPERLKPAALWVYNNIVEPDPAKRTFDTVSPYPHRAVLALVNWPIGVREVNPAELVPRVHWDSKRRHYVFRNQWTGTEDDIVVNATFGARDGHPFVVFGKGQRTNFGSCPRAEVTHFQPAEDGSGTVSAGGVALGVDFSKASGADALIVTTGRGAGGGAQVVAGEVTYHVITLGGKPPAAQVQDGKVVIGGQAFRFDGQKIVFDRMAGPPRLGRMGMW
jgi:hypothetical protein